MSNLKPAQILILSSAEVPETRAINDDFIAKLNQRLTNCQLIWHNYQEVGLRIQNGKLEAFVVKTNQPLSDFKAVYFKSYFRYAELAAAIAEALQENSVKFIGSELKHYVPVTKLTQLARLARAGLPIPQTIYLPTIHFLDYYDQVVGELGDKFIFKAIDGSTGEDNYLIKSREQLQQVIQKHPELHYIAQNFIPNDSDMRVLIVGGEIKLLIERRRTDDTTHLNNTSQGAKAKLVPLSELSDELKAISLKAAQVMNREVAGVDLMLDKQTGQPYILEVNASPQIGSGAYMDEKLATYSEFFTKLAGGNE